MTKEELKKEAEEYALNQWEGNLPWSVIQKAYYDGALPREKQIQIDAEQIRALQKQNGELTDKVKELEEELIKADNATDVFNAQEKRIAELETQIEKMKCCENCDFIFRDGNCYYDKECKNKDHWKLRR